MSLQNALVALVIVVVFQWLKSKFPTLKFPTLPSVPVAPKPDEPPVPLTPAQPLLPGLKDRPVLQGLLAAAKLILAAKLGGGVFGSAEDEDAALEQWLREKLAEEVKK